MAEATLADVERLAENLSPDEHLLLIEHLVHRLRHTVHLPLYSGRDDRRLPFASHVETATKSAPALTAHAVSEEMILEGMVHHEIGGKMAPIRDDSVRVRVRSVEPAIPHVVGLEDG